MVNFGPLAAEIGSLVWGTAANFNAFHILAALLHGTVVSDYFDRMLLLLDRFAVLHT